VKLPDFIRKELEHWKTCRICGEMVRDADAHTLCRINAGEIKLPVNEDGTITFHIIHGKEKDDMS